MALNCTTTTTPGTPATPATLLADFKLGWDSSAISTDNLPGNGRFSFSVGENSLGVVAGLSATFSGSSYREIQFGFYANKGKMLVMESGVNKTSTFPVNGQSVQIERFAGKIRYRIDGDVVYTSTQTSDAPLVAAAMFYSGGDTVTGATFAALDVSGGNKGSGSAHLQALASRGGSGAVKKGAYNLLQPLQTHGGSGTRNNLQPLTAYGGAGAYASSVTHLQPLTTSGGAGLIVPTYALSTNALPFLHTLAHGVTCEPMRVTAALQPLVSVGADHPYGYSVNNFQPLGNMAGEGIRIDGCAQLKLTGGYTINAQATQQTMQGLSATLPMLTMQAQGGGCMVARLPMPTLTISGTFPAVGRAVMRLPACTLTASGTVGGTATARLTLPGGYAVTARTGAQAFLSIAPYGYRLNGAGLAGGVAVARLSLRGHYALDAHALAEAYARAEMRLPALRMTSGAVARMRLPKPIIRAVVTDRSIT